MGFGRRKAPRNRVRDGALPAGATQEAQMSELSKEATEKKAANTDPAPVVAQRMRPVIGHDNGWWWDRIN